MSNGSCPDASPAGPLSVGARALTCTAGRALPGGVAASASLEGGSPASEHAAATPTSAALPRSLARRLFSNAFWTTGGKVASLGAAFVASLILGRRLSQEEFSAYTLASAAVAFLAMPAAAGAPRVVLRLIREGLATDRPALVTGSLQGCLKTVVATTAALALLFVALTPLAAESAQWRAVRDYRLLVAAWFSASALCVVIAHALQGVDAFRSSALVGARSGGMLPNLLFLAVASLAAAAGRLTLPFALAAQVAVTAFALAWGGWVLCRSVAPYAAAARRRPADVPPAPATSGWGFFQECWPLLIIQLTSLGIYQIDVLLVGWLTDPRQVAAYGAVARLGELLAAAQILATGIAAPFVSELYAKKQLDRLERLLRGIASLVALPTLAIGGAYLLAPEMVIERTFGPRFLEGALTLQIITAGSMAASLTGTNALVLIMAGRQRELLKLSAVVNVVYLITAPLLIQRWGIAGAATATAIIFGVYNIVVTLLVRARIGIWTVPTMAPRAYAEAVRQVLKRAVP